MPEYRLTDFSARGDGQFDNTKAFAKALAAIAEGGTLHIGPGVWKTGPIVVRGRDIRLILDEEATISFIPDERLHEPVLSRWEGVNCHCLVPCLFVVDAKDVTIEGKGTLDGNGAYWWKLASYKREFQMEPVTETEKRLAALNPGYAEQSSGGGGRQSQFLRPPLLQILHSSQVTVQDVRFVDSPFWTVHPLYSEGILLKNIAIKNPKDAPNTDGIDIDSCRSVRVEGAVIDVGDDGIALKSGSGPDGISVGIPTRDVLITHCTVKNAHGGAVMGSETAAGIDTVTVSDCLFDQTDRGIRIKTRRGRGGRIANLRFEHLVMRHNLCPLTINMYYGCGSSDDRPFSLDVEPVDSLTPVVSDIVVSDCIAEQARASIAFIVGLPESPIEGLTLQRCRFSLAADDTTPAGESEMTRGLPEAEGKGMRLRNVRIRLDQVAITKTIQPIIVEDNVELIS